MNRLTCPMCTEKDVAFLLPVTEGNQHKYFLLLLAGRTDLITVQGAVLGVTETRCTTLESLTKSVD
jgi:hypothetical protein